MKIERRRETLDTVECIYLSIDDGFFVDTYRIYRHPSHYAIAKVGSTFVELVGQLPKFMNDDYCEDIRDIKLLLNRLFIFAVDNMVFEYQIDELDADALPRLLLPIFFGL